MNAPFLQNLNSKQKEAVVYINGPSLILAGAGSGKTRVLSYKAGYLLDQKKTTAEALLMLTFTNKAAGEMKERVKKYIDPLLKPELINAATFHSFATNVLRHFGTAIRKSHDFVIFDKADSKDLLKEILKEESQKPRVTINSLAYQIGLAKNQLLNPKRLKQQAHDSYSEIIAEYYQKYQNKLQQNNALDFDDLLNETVYLLQENPQVLRKLQKQYQYLLIDEYQDTNHSQYLIAKLLSQDNAQITVVGDFSQSIYSWRGADFTNLEKFQKDHPQAKVFNLEQNYRSTQPILDFAYKVISQNTTHPILQLFTEDNSGEEIETVPLENSEQEAVYVINKIQELNFRGDYSLQDFAILYRTNAQSRQFEEACLKNSLPYRIYGGVRFYERKEIKDVLSFLRYLNNKEDKIALKRIAKLGKKRSQEIIKTITQQNPDRKPEEIIQEILKNSPYLNLYSEADPEDNARLENIQELVNVSYSHNNLTEFLDSVALIEAGYEFESAQKEKIHLMTLHSVKGLEFAVVFIVGVEEGILPHSRSANSLEELEEERRLFYVGITRAKQKLVITYTKRRYLYGRAQYNLPSQFLEEDSAWQNFADNNEF
jgi:DNA helicase II / ATP-dependent DNA helicase PcrA